MLGSFVVVAVVLLVLASIAWLVVRRVGGADAGPVGEERAKRWRWAGIALGLVAAGVVAAADTLGRGQLIAAPVFGLCVLAGTLTGELTRPGVGGDGVRVALLRTRSVLDYVPKRLSALVIMATLALVALGAATTALAGPDESGRAGRALTCTFNDFSQIRTPWPGRYYTLPGVVILAACLLATAVTLRRVVHRPQAAASAAADDAGRRRSAEVVLAAAGVSVLVPLTGVAFTAHFAGSNLCTPRWWTGLDHALPVVAVASFAAAAWCIAGLLTPGRPAGRKAALPHAEAEL